MDAARAAREDDGTAESVPSVFLPSLLAGIDTDETETARTAGYGLSLLVRAYPRTGSRVASELVGRLATEESRQPVRRTLASIREIDDECVRTALRDEVGGEYARQLYASIDDADSWDLSRRLSADGGEAEEFLTEFRRIVRLDDDDRSRDGSDTDVLDASDASVDRSDSGPQESSTDDEGGVPAPASAGGGGTSRAVLTKRERIERAADSETFQTIAFRSAFDGLDVVAPETERRYANVLRARGTIEDTERGIALRLLDVPGDRAEFDPVVSDRLQAWTRLAQTDGVVTVVDWGDTPRPWIATEYIEETLAGRGRVDPARALREARALAGTLVRIHQHNVVHGGIDPQNVVYPTSSIDGRGRPLFDNVGLIRAYRRQFDPANYLDPRYAAPEYYDSQYGGFDHGTDIYQLGMVCYRLCTGRHPFDGSYDTVRTSVLEDRPPAPSEITPALPSAVDEVVAKATAKQKLTRYETTNALYRDLTRICETTLD